MKLLTININKLSTLAKNGALAAMLILVGCGGAADSADAPSETVITIPSEDGLISVALATSHELSKETLSNGAQSRYIVHFSAQVTSRTGTPLANRRVSITTNLIQATQGRWSYTEPQPSMGDSPATVGKWKREPVTGICTDNSFETGVAVTDANGASQTAFTTDNTGKLSFDVRYGRNYATWVTYNLVVRSETSIVRFEERLGYLGEDLDDMGGTAPSFVSSPFNGRAGCTPPP